MNQSHLDMDDMGEWAESHPITQRAHRALPLPEAHYTAPQGRPEQGWPVRRCSPEVQPHVMDRMRESFDREDQSDGADGVFWIYIATIGSVIAAAVLAVFA